MGMIYLLDTNAWISYLNDRQSRVAQRVERTDPSVLRSCSVVRAELCYGAWKSLRREKNLALLAECFSRFISLPFDDIAADLYGQIRADLESRGTPIGPHDLMIAATARVHDLTVVTHNTREFGRVPGLALEDWEIAP